MLKDINHGTYALFGIASSDAFLLLNESKTKYTLKITQSTQKQKLTFFIFIPLLKCFAQIDRNIVQKALHMTVTFVNNINNINMYIQHEQQISSIGMCSNL